MAYGLPIKVIFISPTAPNTSPKTETDEMSNEIILYA